MENIKCEKIVIFTDVNFNIKKEDVIFFELSSCLNINKLHSLLPHSGNKISSNNLYFNNIILKVSSTKFTCNLLRMIMCFIFPSHSKTSMARRIYTSDRDDGEISHCKLTNNIPYVITKLVSLYYFYFVFNVSFFICL